MKTQQMGSDIPPSEENDVLAMIIKCPKCQTQRAFQITKSIGAVTDRESSGMEHSTICEICGHRTNVQIAWTMRHPMWVSERLVFQKLVSVEDDFGMTKAEGGKAI